MKVIGINGSPRRNWNTAILLEKALEGAASQGAETELNHLYDLNYKGCTSCFACKTRGGKSYGKCATADDLMTIFNKFDGIDAIILASPIYFGSVTGEMRSFIERLMFPYLSYTSPSQSLFQRTINIGYIYTMNMEEDQFEQYEYDKYISKQGDPLKLIFGGNLESLCCYDTYQFKDYSKVVADRFDVEQKVIRRDEVFPKDCSKAFELGSRLVVTR